MSKVEIIKSALKFLVQKQIEQGSCGFSNTDDDEISWDEVIGWLEQQPKTIQEKQAESEKYQKAFDDGYENGYAQARFDYEQQPCKDCISREVVIEDVIKCTDMNEDTMEVLEDKVRALQSVQPQPKRGSEDAK